MTADEIRAAIVQSNGKTAAQNTATTSSKTSSAANNSGGLNPLSYYLNGITSTNPYYSKITDAWNAGQGATNWGSGASPEAISKGTTAAMSNRDKLASLMAQGLAWKPAATTSTNNMGLNSGYSPYSSAGTYWGTANSSGTGLYGPTWGGGRAGGGGVGGYGAGVS